MTSRESRSEDEGKQERRQGGVQLLFLLRRKGEGFLILGGGIDFRQTYRQAVQYFGIDREKPTPHGVRRGGGLRGISVSMDRTAGLSTTGVGHARKQLGRTLTKLVLPMPSWSAPLKAKLIIINDGQQKN